HVGESFCQLLRIHDIKSLSAPRPRNYTDPIARFPRRPPIMASDAADALAKTYARNKKLLSLRSITNGLQQTGLLVACTYRASVHLDPPPTAAMIKNPVT
ncbi:MAG: hypothetical protein WB499_14035, partial [Pseudolabrys sp.]